MLNLNRQHALHCAMHKSRVSQIDGNDNKSHIHKPHLGSS